jgi:hypothetical protein
MKKFAIIILLLQGCSEPELSQKIFGEWNISWIIEDNSRSGQLVLNRNHSGTLTVKEDLTSLIIPNKESIKFTWSYDEQTLKLKRSDNDIELIYVIYEKRDKQIDMVFADDIIVNISR